MFKNNNVRMHLIYTMNQKIQICDKFYMIWHKDIILVSINNTTLIIIKISKIINELNKNHT